MCKATSVDFHNLGRWHSNHDWLNVSTTLAENDLIVVNITVAGNAASYVGVYECFNGRGFESVNTVKIVRKTQAVAWSGWSEWTKWCLPQIIVICMYIEKCAFVGNTSVFT
jgi:hypothetical protein